MAARRAASFDDKRARIAALAREPRAIAMAELRRFLGDKVAYLAGEAAHVAHELELTELVPDIAAAFERFMIDGATVDRGCLGKKRLLDALLAFEAYVPETYLKGIRYEQREPDFPVASDTAAPIRGLSAHALVQIDYAAALLEVAPLLADAHPIVRAEAARALARSGIEAAGAVLHLRIAAGDREPDVLQACFEGLLRLGPGRYLRIVSNALRGADDSSADAAALALGESRLPEALTILKEALARAEAPRQRQTLMMAIGLCRSDDALAFLIGIVEKEPERDVIDALAALSLHRHDEPLAERVRAMVAGRKSRRLTAAVEERFGG